MSCLPPVPTQSDPDVHLLASPVIQTVSQPCGLESTPCTVATSSSLPSATNSLKGGGRRRDPDHVPRPLNCFFLFKADWLAKRKSLLAEIEQDNRQLNRMASSEWKKLPQEVKQRFKDAARRAKVEHATKYPEYRYTPKPRGDRRRRKTRRNEPEVLLRNEEAARLVSQGITGDALLKALADHDRRAAQRPISREASPPSFSEALPCTAPTSYSDSTPSPSVDVYSSPDLAVRQALVDLEDLLGTLAGSSHSVCQIAPPQHAPVVEDNQALLAEPARDPYSLHFDYFLPGDSTTPIPQPRGLSDQFLRTDHRIEHESDWSYHSAYPIGETQGTYPSFQTDPSLIQAAHTAIPTNTSGDCWNMAALQQNIFPTHDPTNSLNFAFLCTSGTSGSAPSVPGDSQGIFSPMNEPAYHWSAFPSYVALFNSSVTDGLDWDPTIATY